MKAACQPYKDGMQVNVSDCTGGLDVALATIAVVSLLLSVADFFRKVQESAGNSELAGGAH